MTSFNRSFFGKGSCAESVDLSYIAIPARPRFVLILHPPSHSPALSTQMASQAVVSTKKVEDPLAFVKDLLAGGTAG